MYCISVLNDSHHLSILWWWNRETLERCVYLYVHTYIHHPHSINVFNRFKRNANKNVAVSSFEKYQKWVIQFGIGYFHTQGYSKIGKYLNLIKRFNVRFIHNHISLSIIVKCCYCTMRAYFRMTIDGMRYLKHYWCLKTGALRDHP